MAAMSDRQAVGCGLECGPADAVRDAPPGPGRRVPSGQAMLSRRALLGAAGALALDSSTPRGAWASEEGAPAVKVPYVPTPWPVVAAMLELGQVGARDFLIDLGSGDGRLVIEAARTRGARGLGVELDADLVQLSLSEARRLGVADRVRFLRQDLFETDITPATVITLYLLPPVMMALRPRLSTALAPGTRLVSHDFTLGDWSPDRTVKVDVPEKSYGPPYSLLHLWVVPAFVDGRWQGRFGSGADEQAYALDLRQQFQRVTGTLTLRGRSVRLESAELDGDRLALVAEVDLPKGRERHQLQAQVRGGRLEGSWRVSPVGGGRAPIIQPTAAERPPAKAR